MLDLLHTRAQLDVRRGALSLSASAPIRLLDDDVKLEEAWAGQCSRDGVAMSADGVGAPRVLRHAQWSMIHIICLYVFLCYQR